MNNLTKELRSAIREVPDFPKEGILFLDITTFLNTPLFAKTIDFLAHRYKDFELDYICGVESRGFIFGSALAYALKIGFVPIRKPKKLPSKIFIEDYDLEYGKDSLAIHEDAFAPGSKDPKVLLPKVLLIDDLIATGGSALASERLIKRASGSIVEACFLIELMEFKGRDRLDSRTFSLLQI